MKKNLYSLTLSDEVVREVDALAHRLGTNRSALVNRILSEYVSVPTPERRINDIFEAIEALVSPSRELVPFFAPNSQSMSLKSSLAYKYRPTVKYEVDLGGGEDTLGTLNVVFRTQSAELIAALTDFFRLWARIENACLAPALGGTIACSLYDGRFVRPLAMPRGHARSAEDIAGAISAYVQLFDRLLMGAMADVKRKFPNVKTEILYDDLQYENVAYTLHPQAQSLVENAAAKIGKAITFADERGGTTASMFAAKGLNGGMCVFSGQHDIHSTREYADLQEMEDCYRLMLEIIQGVAALK